MALTGLTSKVVKVAGVALLAAAILTTILQGRQAKRDRIRGDSLNVVATQKDSSATHWEDLATALRLNLRTVTGRMETVGRAAQDTAEQLGAEVDALAAQLRDRVAPEDRPLVDSLIRKHEGERNAWRLTRRSDSTTIALLFRQVEVDSIAIDSLRVRGDSWKVASEHWEASFERATTGWSFLGLKARCGASVTAGLDIHGKPNAVIGPGCSVSF